jgi:hypothetical protein
MQYDDQNTSENTIYFTGNINAWHLLALFATVSLLVIAFQLGDITMCEVIYDWHRS